MNLKIIAPVTFFTAEKTIKSLDQYNFQSDSNGVLKDFLSIEQNVAIIGLLDYDFLSKTPCFNLIGDISKIFDINENQYEATERVHAYLGYLLNLLWFIKDNSVFSEFCYSVNEQMFFTRNVRHINVSTATGEYRHTSFTAEELNAVMELVEKLSPLYNSINVDDKRQFANHRTVSGLVENLNYNSFDRITRAINFLTTARYTTLLPQKISFYIAMLECLFTTDGGEISHKVSERATMVLSGSYEEKLSNYKKIKTAYDVRSKYMHGQALSLKKGDPNEQLRVISSDIDNVVRLIMLEIINNQQDKYANDESLNNWFKAMLFNAPTA